MTVDWVQVATLFKEAITNILTLKPTSNRAARYPGAASSIDLTTARAAVSLTLSGYSLTVVSVGNGVYSFEIEFSDGTTCEFDSTELNAGDSWDLEFSDVHFTNAAQGGLTGPSFYYSWRE